MRALPIALLLLAAPTLAGQPKKRPEDAVQGEQLWEEHCWFCHGTENDGRGPSAPALVLEVPDLRGAITPKRFDALAQYVLDGSPTHPAYSTELDKHQARRIMIYLKKLEDERPAAPPPAEDPPAEDPPGGAP